MPDSLLPTSSKEPIYSYRWAWGVYHQLREKYTRATDIFLEFTELTPKQLVNYLIRSDPLWPHIRLAIKVLYNWEKRAPKEWDLWHLEHWVGACKCHCQQRLTDYLHKCLVSWKEKDPDKVFGLVEGLTAEENGPILKEQ